MKSTPPRKSSFGKALKRSRKALGLSQESFALSSSRTYVSTLERGLKSPTLEKVEALCETMGVHPLTLLSMAYLSEMEPKAARQLASAVLSEVEVLLQKSSGEKQ